MDDEELQIEYPCRWEYTVVGRDEDAVRDAARRIVGEREFTLRVSKRSAAGTYVSLKLEVEVDGEAMRRGLWQELADSPAVLYLI